MKLTIYIKREFKDVEGNTYCANELENSHKKAFDNENLIHTLVLFVVKLISFFFIKQLL